MKEINTNDSMFSEKPVSLAPGVYWVGSHTLHKSLVCNPYLIVDGDEGVLIDPGNVLDFEIVLAKVKELIPLEKIKTIILHHQDPDFCSSLPLWEKAGFKGQLALHWRTSLIVQYYGITSPFYVVNENQYRLVLSGGRLLRFIGAPYLHFPGSIMTYDETSRILFSGDLFGAMSEQQTLFADEKYPERMKAFHEHYMPSQAILKAAMDKVMPLALDFIAPQHGCIIHKNVKDYVRILSNLECGSLQGVDRQDLSRAGGYMALCNQLIQRINVLFPETDWHEIFEGTRIEYDAEAGMIRDFDYEGVQFWNLFFARIYLKRGASWLSAVEPVVSRMVQTYNIEYPAIYQSRFIELEINQAKLDTEALALQSLRRRLEEQEAEAQKKMMTCPVTGLHNEKYFRFFGNEEFSPLRKQPPDSWFIFITLDRFLEINLELGSEEGDRMLASLAYLLENYLNGKGNSGIDHLFRLNGPRFLYYLGKADENIARRTAVELRREVSDSELFIKPVTISQGVVDSASIFNPETSAAAMIDKLLLTGEATLRTAQKQGPNTIVFSSSLTEERSRIGRRILIIDPDTYYARFLAREWEARDCQVVSCVQGEEALSYIQENPPDLIVSELSVPMFSGLEIRSLLLGDPHLSKIPFVLVSHRRDDDLIRQAHKLKIVHYLAKPVSLVELLGLSEILLEHGE